MAWYLISGTSFPHLPCFFLRFMFLGKVVVQYIIHLLGRWLGDFFLPTRTSHNFARRRHEQLALSTVPLLLFVQDVRHNFNVRSGNTTVLWWSGDKLRLRLTAHSLWASAGWNALWFEIFWQRRSIREWSEFGLLYFLKLGFRWVVLVTVQVSAVNSLDIGCLLVWALCELKHLDLELAPHQVMRQLHVLPWFASLHATVCLIA